MLQTLVQFALLPNVHAHNDYEHTRPLLDALDQGFLSVEADIFLVDGELRVGHSRKALKPGRTLESLYLDPLAARIRANHGTVYGQPGCLSLLVDIKAEGKEVQAELTKRLSKYKDILTERTGTTVNVRAIQIILSGARTADCASIDGFLFKDGHLDEIEDDPSRTPWISENYDSALGTPASPLTPEGKTKLTQLVTKTHATHKRLRLWGAPDGPVTWSELKMAGVDLLNTDRLADMRHFLVADKY